MIAKEAKNSHHNPKYLTKPSQVPQLSPKELEDAQRVCEKFAFRSNQYYQSLIDWNDPDDPIRRIAVPTREELQTWGRIDASNEKSYTVAPGVEHKYFDTAVLLVNDVCGANCRFCFRKRLFMRGHDEIAREVRKGLDYIAVHPEINNVLVTGGDPLLLPTPKLDRILAKLRSLDHIRIIRIGSKMPAFNPHRILNDPELLETISKHSTPERKIYIMAHFNHSRELTAEAKQALSLLMRAGAIVVNQTPLIRGVNDTPRTLLELFESLSFIGVPPYYVFQCRPTIGNKPYVLPVERAYDIFRKAQSLCSGLAARARFAISHASGKVEVVGMNAHQIVMRYHRAARPEDAARTLILDRDPKAYWLDDYREFSTAHPGRTRYRDALVRIHAATNPTGAKNHTVWTKTVDSKRPYA